MRAILNVIWLVLSGFWLAIGYAFAGLVCCLLIITIPFGLASFRIAGYALWPFGRTVTERRTAGIPSLLGNIVWLLVAGWWLALAHVATGIALCVTVVGIPLGIGNFKLVPVALLPLGREIVSTR
ncbi:YccF domain-containing protein [Saccharomonospora cyanea]|uniref:Putative membrane protein n=1 Tax=Saccharomonospora cyanea NA-134 TaxID=882082 RepID=H5XQ51_9PSEU|nr:YccF domain-containing protein [Saccharomonospora cyanea]EHR63317.1 putative membrane protein [Saccharomonospora cyanea NA-134]